MGLCISSQGSRGDKRDKTINSKRHTQNGKTTHDEMAQQPSLEEAIEKNEKTKESLENEIVELKQQLKGSRYGSHISVW